MPHLSSQARAAANCAPTLLVMSSQIPPEDLKLIMIDPKVVELAEYNGIPHLLMPVVTELRKCRGR